MTTSTFVRFLLAPLVALGIILGLSVSSLIFPSAVANASVPSAAAVTCKSLMKNDRIYPNATRNGVFVRVFLGCSAGDTTSCGARLYWQIYDENQDLVCGGIPADKIRQCGAAQIDVSWGPIPIYVTPSGQVLEPGYYEFVYSIYRIENGQVDLTNPIVGSEWYAVF